MAIDSELSTVQAVPLARYLRDHRERILQRWTERVAQRVRPARDLSPPLLRDHIPMLLDELAQALEAGESRSTALDEIPTIHALERLDEGFDLRQVATEYRLLRKTIYQLLDEDHVRPTTVVEASLFHEAVDNAITSSIEHYARARNKTLEALDRISEVALSNQQPDLETFLSRLLGILMETTEAVDAVSILLTEPGNRLRVRAAVGEGHEQTLGRTVEMGQCAPGRVAQTGEPLLLRDGQNNPLLTSDTVAKAHLQALYVVPLQRQDRLIGVAMMGSHTTQEFTQTDLLLFRSMADRATLIITQVDMAQRELRLRELTRDALAQVEGLLDAAPVGIAFLDTEMRYLRLNAWLAELNGLPMAAHIGRRVSEVLPRTGPSIEQAMREVVRTGVPVRGVAFEISREGGPPRYVVADYFPVSAGGTVLGVGAVLVDETERRMAEAAAKVIQARLQAIVDHAPAPIFLKDDLGQYVLANEAMAKTLGRTREEIVGRRDDELFPPEVARELRQHDREVLERGQAVAVEERLPLLESPEARTFLSLKFPLPESPLDRGRLGGISTDITDHQRLQRELLDRNQQFRALADNMAQLAWMAHPDGDIYWYNKRFLEFTGATLEQVRGDGWISLHHPDHVERVVTKIRRHFRSGEEWEDTFPLRGRDGEYRWFLSRMFPIRDEAGRVLRWFGTNTDISERMRDDEFRDRLIGIVSHDLRNPLSVIRTGAALLIRSEDLPERLRKTVNRIDGASLRMTRLISDLLDFTRGRLGGGLPVQRAPLDLVELAHRIMDEFASGHPDRDFRFASRGTALGEWDPDRLAQALTNLLENARRYADPAHPVEVTVDGTGERVRLSVKNHGAQIPADTLPLLFQPFRRATDRQQREGLGLGLYITHLIAEAHQGTLHATSTAEGETTFALELPRTPAGEDTGEKQPHAE